MESNYYILGFSLFITLLTVLSFVFMSKEFSYMAKNEKSQKGEETGPRADLFDRLYVFFSEDEQETDQETVGLKPYLEDGGDKNV